MSIKKQNKKQTKQQERQAEWAGCNTCYLGPICKICLPQCEYGLFIILKGRNAQCYPLPVKANSAMFFYMFKSTRVFSVLCQHKHCYLVHPLCFIHISQTFPLQLAAMHCSRNMYLSLAIRHCCFGSFLQAMILISFYHLIYFFLHFTGGSVKCLSFLKIFFVQLLLFL